MFQAQKKTYRREKKKAAKELLSTLKDPSVILIADWLKVGYLIFNFCEHH